MTTPTSAPPDPDFPLPIGPNEVITGTELAGRLHLSEEAARQKISRAAKKGVLWRSEKLQLPGGGRLYARNSFAGQQAFLEQIRPRLANRPGIARVLDAMLRSPAIHEHTLTKLLAATMDPTKFPGQRSVSDEVLVLDELGIGKVDFHTTNRNRFVRPTLYGKDESVDWCRALSAQQLLDEQLTKLLLLSFKRQNLVSWTFEPEAGMEHSFNGQWFSAHGYSWLRPIVTPIPGAKPDPCPVVFDVRSTAATVADVEAFATRIRHAGYRPNSKLRILGVMGAKFFEPAAHDLGKKNGFILVNFHQEIGNEALEALAAIEKILGAAPSTAKPDFDDLFKKLRYHPQAKELAARAFESFATAIAQAHAWSNVHTNFLVPFGKEEQGSWREVDVMGERGDHHLAIECKAYGRDKLLTVEDVTKFFKQTVPSYLKHYSQKKKVLELTAEIWTTGQIPPECHAKLAEIKATSSETHHYALRGPKDIVIPSKVASLRNLLDSITDL